MPCYCSCDSINAVGVTYIMDSDASLLIDSCPFTPESITKRICSAYSNKYWVLHSLLVSSGGRFTEFFVLKSADFATSNKQHFVQYVDN